MTVESIPLPEIPTLNTVPQSLSFSRLHIQSRVLDSERSRRVCRALSVTTGPVIYKGSARYDASRARRGRDRMQRLLIVCRVPLSCAEANFRGELVVQQQQQHDAGQSVQTTHIVQVSTAGVVCVFHFCS